MRARASLIAVKTLVLSVVALLLIPVVEASTFALPATKYCELLLGAETAIMNFAVIRIDIAGDDEPGYGDVVVITDKPRSQPEQEKPSNERPEIGPEPGLEIITPTPREEIVPPPPPTAPEEAPPVEKKTPPKPYLN